MTVIATCGHTLTKQEDMGINIMVKDQHKDGSKAVSYIVVCTKCYEWYKKEGIILRTEKKADKWLTDNSAN